MSEVEIGETADGVRAVDREGNEVVVPRDVWAREVLPAMVQQAWDQPEPLYMIIANSLAEGFVAQITEAAAHLYATDPVPARGASTWAAVLIRLDRLVEAELVLTRHGDRHGDNSAVMLTLAQVYAAKGEEVRAAETRVRAEALAAQQVHIGMVRVDGPVWLPVGSPARKIFGLKALDAPAVTFLGGSAETAGELTDALARMTRALPLFLAEQTELRTAAAGRALLPWAAGAEGVRPGGFLVSQQAWPDATAVQMVEAPANRSEYVVTVHVDAEVSPWEATLAFLRASDGTRIGELHAEFDADAPGDGLHALADETVELLEALGPGAGALEYIIPKDFGQYLDGLENLLAARCSEMPLAPALATARETLEGGFALCDAEPENVPARLLLLETLGAVRHGSPDIAEEFRERFSSLTSRRPLPLLDAAFG